MSILISRFLLHKMCNINLCKNIFIKSYRNLRTLQYVRTDLFPQTNKMICYQLIRNKYKKGSSSSSSQDKDLDSDDEISTDFKEERDSKVIKTSVNSLRADLILKAGLNIARNKIEVIFYESKIRVNGKKLMKKSEQLNIGDEIDIIKGFSTVNPSHLIISRVVVLSVESKENNEGIWAHLRRYKNLLVENYEGSNAFKKSSEI